MCHDYGQLQAKQIYFMNAGAVLRFLVRGLRAQVSNVNIVAKAVAWSQNPMLSAGVRLTGVENTNNLNVSSILSVIVKE